MINKKLLFVLLLIIIGLVIISYALFVMPIRKENNVGNANAIITSNNFDNTDEAGNKCKFRCVKDGANTWNGHCGVGCPCGAGYTCKNIWGVIKPTAIE